MSGKKVGAFKFGQNAFRKSVLVLSTFYFRKVLRGDWLNKFICTESNTPFASLRGSEFLRQRVILQPRNICLLGNSWRGFGGE